MIRLTSGQINSFYLIASCNWSCKVSDLSTMLNIGDKSIDKTKKQLALASALLNSIKAYVPNQEIRCCMPAECATTTPPFTAYNELAPADFIIKEVIIICDSKVWVTYNRPFNAGYATNTLYYSLDNGINIIGITQINATTVEIKTDKLTYGVTYTLTVYNVIDTNSVEIFPNPNVISFTASEGVDCLTYEEVFGNMEKIAKILNICIDYNQLADTPFDGCGCD